MPVFQDHFCNAPPGHNRSGMVDIKMTDPAEGARGLEMRFLSGVVFNARRLPGGISAPGD